MIAKTELSVEILYSKELKKYFLITNNLRFVLKLKCCSVTQLLFIKIPDEEAQSAIRIMKLIEVDSEKYINYKSERQIKLELLGK